MGKIAVLLVFTELEKETMLTIKQHLESTFALPVEFYGLILDLSEAYNFKRNQYSSSLIIEILSRYKKNRKEKWITIVDVDLYGPGYNFVFGEANWSKGIAVVSKTRLRPEFYGSKPNEKLFTERLLKEITHELGHLFFLTHCENPKCVMYFSNTILDTDKKEKEFCFICKCLLRAYQILENF